MLKAGQESLPFTNTRLLLAEETDNDDSYFLGSGVVVRLFSSPTSHPAVRQTLQGLHARCGGRPAGHPTRFRSCLPCGCGPQEACWATRVQGSV